MAVKQRSGKFWPSGACAQFDGEPSEPLSTQVREHALQRDQVIHPPVAGIGDAEAAARLIGSGRGRRQVAREIGKGTARDNNAASSPEPSGSSPSSASAALM